MQPPRNNRHGFYLTPDGGYSTPDGVASTPEGVASTPDWFYLSLALSKQFIQERSATGKVERNEARRLPSRWALAPPSVKACPPL